MYSTINEVFDSAMPSRFNTQNGTVDPVTYDFNILDVAVKRVTVTSQLTIEDYNDTMPAPNVTLTMNEQDFLDLVNGKVGIQILFLTGRMQIAGDLTSALKLVRIFPEG